MLSHIRAAVPDQSGGEKTTFQSLFMLSTWQPPCFTAFSDEPPFS